MRVQLEAPPGFSFARTLLGHGWCRLAPFSVDAAAGVLSGVLPLPAGGALAYSLRCPDGHPIAESDSSGDAAHRRALRAAGRRILNLDADLSEFHALARRSADLAWIAETGSGRLLRAPTIFEDLVKLVLTTNCSWAMTTQMVERLVESWGEPASDGRRAFPRAEALASAGERALRERGRVGYRARSLSRLATEVAEGRVDLEAWEREPRDPEDLRGEMLGLPGVGPYVAESLLKLLGRPAGLALDSWLRGKYARVYHGGRRVADRTIARRYHRLGGFAGLALWCEMTRDWFEDDRPAAAWRALG